MSDPFGALATQRRSDSPYFDGTQWAPSSAGGVDFRGGPMGTKSSWADGTSTAPVRVAQPTFKIVRTELIGAGVSPNPVDPLHNAALYVNVGSLVGNKVQPTAGAFEAQGYAEGDLFVLGLSTVANHTSGALSGGLWGGAGGIFAAANTTVVGGGSQAFLGEVGNSTGADVPWVNTGSVMAGMDMAYDSPGANYGGAGVQLRAVNGKFDVGFATCEGSIQSWDIRLRTGAKVLMGTVNSSSFYEMDYNSGNAAILFQTSGTHLPYLFYNGNFCLELDDVNAWTPTANQTAVHMWEGVTPTKRRVQWKDGASIGAGDKVMVLV